MYEERPGAEEKLITDLVSRVYAQVSLYFFVTPHDTYTWYRPRPTSHRLVTRPWSRSHMSTSNIQMRRP